MLSKHLIVKISKNKSQLFHSEVEEAVWSVLAQHGRCHLRRFSMTEAWTNGLGMDQAFVSVFPSTNVDLRSIATDFLLAQRVRELSWSSEQNKWKRNVRYVSSGSARGCWERFNQQKNSEVEKDSPAWLLWGEHLWMEYYRNEICMAHWSMWRKSNGTTPLIRTVMTATKNMTRQSKRSCSRGSHNYAPQQ